MWMNLTTSQDVTASQNKDLVLNTSAPYRWQFLTHQRAFGLFFVSLIVAFFYKSPAYKKILMLVAQ